MAYRRENVSLLCMAAAILLAFSMLFTHPCLSFFGGIETFFNGLFGRFSIGSTAQAAVGVTQVLAPDFLSPYYFGTPEDNAQYWERVVVSVLYEDGTVGVACKEEYRSHYAQVSKWRNIKEIWGDVEIWGLREDGTVVTTAQTDVSHLKNVQDFVDGYARMADGSMEALSGGLPLPVDHVKKIVAVNPTYPEWGHRILCEDGTVYFVQEFWSEHNPEIIAHAFPDWGRIQDIDRIAAYGADGTVYLHDELEAQLHGCVKLVESGDLVYGMTADGELKIGGNPERFTPEIMDGQWYTEMEKYRFTGVKDILDHSDMRSGEVVILYEDGTVFSPCAPLNNLIRDWTDIETVAWYEDYDTITLYGLRKDGSVLALESVFGFFDATIYEQYRGWVLEDLYVKRFSGCIGVCPDGTLVGDHAFAGLDYSQMT